ncbi:hypothetical protein AZE99_12630 [Sphingorhabdus sp. M41]|nr:hypothetical protein AZE99_12630 [Sphingorhabdus sp. M41]
MRRLSFALALTLFAQPAFAENMTANNFSPADVSANAPEELDYTDPASWAAFPGQGGPALTVPSEATPIALDPQVDVFYIHPTTDKARDYINQPVLKDVKGRQWTDESVIARQASAFNACCSLYAPYYRQATAGAFINLSVMETAFDIAYSDVRRAFEHFLAIRENDRPFIIAGHSQGAMHTRRLLTELIDGEPISESLVAAYVIGVGVSNGDFGRTWHDLQPCRTPAQTGCVISWNSMLPDSARAEYAKLVKSTYVAKFGREGSDLLCINPLTFNTDAPSAPAEQSLGAIPGEPGAGPVSRIASGKLSAYCAKDGLLIVEPATELDLQPLPSGSMHYHDIGLFYEDVRSNAMLRSRIFLERKAASKAQKK